MQLLVPGIFIHSARKHNIFYSVHNNRPAMHIYRIIRPREIWRNIKFRNNHLLDLLTGSRKSLAEPEETTPLITLRNHNMFEEKLNILLN